MKLESTSLTLFLHFATQLVPWMIYREITQQLVNLIRYKTCHMQKIFQKCKKMSCFWSWSNKNAEKHVFVGFSFSSLLNSGTLLHFFTSHANQISFEILTTSLHCQLKNSNPNLTKLCSRSLLLSLSTSLYLMNWSLRCIWFSKYNSKNIFNLKQRETVQVTKQFSLPVWKRYAY